MIHTRHVRVIHSCHITHIHAHGCLSYKLTWHSQSSERLACESQQQQRNENVFVASFGHGLITGENEFVRRYI